MKKKVMLVSSSGGHWVQLNRLSPAFEGCDLTFATTGLKYKSTVAKHDFILVPDASRWNKLRLIFLFLSMFKHLLAVRPDIVVSTGAAPGLVAIYIGKKMGAKTIWVDSVANADQLSMSGRLAGKYSDLWLTQWEHLAKKEGPHYEGAVL